MPESGEVFTMENYPVKKTALIFESAYDYHHYYTLV